MTEKELQALLTWPITRKNCQQVYDETRRLQAELNEAQELILDLFRQACLTADSTYDHMYISAYEEAQAYLQKQGDISKDECIRE